LACPCLPFLLGAAIIGFGAGARKSQAQEGSVQVPAVSGITVQLSEQVFDTMCALDASGFEAEENTLAEMPERLALRERLLQLQGPATQAIRKFYREHVLASPTETLTPFMTFAVVSGPPPDFQLPDRDVLPPSVLTIDGFQPLLADFYREARLNALWTSAQPEAQPMIVNFRTGVRHIVTLVDAYLREVEKPSNGRTFTVYVEPLVGARTNFRNQGDAYSIIVGSINDSSVDMIQHAYLHFMLDPFVLRYRPVVDTKRALLPLAARAPQLPDEYHDDFVSLMDECLIKAVELRLRHLSGDRLEAVLKNDDEAGFILVRPLIAQLLKFEKDAPAMSYYFPTLITSIDVDAEQKRAQAIKFASADATSAVSAHGQPVGEPQSELEKWIADGNRQIAQQDAAGAIQTFQAAYEKYPNDPRVIYGLAIASVLSGHALRARDLFEELVAARDAGPAGSAAPSTAPDPSIRAWSHVYLGRIDDLQDERELAVNEYQAALAVPGAPEAARVAAQAGVETAYKPPARPGDSQQPEQ
jgi:tetratricopeptide (TPR) repeat protein